MKWNFQIYILNILYEISIIYKTNGSVLLDLPKVIW